MCQYHLANQCPNKKEKVVKKTKETTADLSLFTKVNELKLITNDENESDEDLVLITTEKETTETLLVKSTMDELCFTAQEDECCSH